MRFIVRALALLCFAVAAQAQNISIATGGTGGVYYPLGGGMAAMLSKYVPGIQATAEVTGGSVGDLPLLGPRAPAEAPGVSPATPQRIGTGKPYLGMTMADATLDPYKGEDKFKGKPVQV